MVELLLHGPTRVRPRIWEDRNVLWDHERSARRRLLHASDVDREQVVEQVRVAAGKGRLTIEELGERIEQAYASRTFADLDPITADLPEGSTVDPAR